MTLTPKQWFHVLSLPTTIEPIEEEDVMHLCKQRISSIQGKLPFMSLEEKRKFLRNTDEHVNLEKPRAFTQNAPLPSHSNIEKQKRAFFSTKKRMKKKPSLPKPTGTVGKMLLSGMISDSSAQCYVHTGFDHTY